MIRRNYSVPFLGILILSAFIFHVFDIEHRGLDSPIEYYGDAVHSLLVAKSIILNGWWWHVPQLSYPNAGLEMLGFPVLGLLDTIFFKFISIFSNSPFVVVNSYFYLSIFLAYFSSYFSFRLLKFTQVTSSIAAVSFAVLPQIYFRNISHLMLAHYLVPFAVIASLFIYDSNIFAERKKQLRPILCLGLFFLGLNYIYTAFFGLFFLCSGLLFRLLRNKKFNLEKTDLLFFGFAFLGVILSLGPTVLFWKTHVDISNILNSIKSAAEADTYGLKLRHLFLPSDTHFLFKSLGQKFSAQPFPLENENSFSKLGTAAFIGFIYINYKAFVALVQKDDKKTESPFILILFLLTYFALLFSSIGGLGSVFNTLISPSIRCYNRISPFLGFIFLIGFSALIDGRFKEKLNSSRIGILFLAAICMMFVAFDERQPTFSNYRVINDEMSLQRTAVLELEAQIDKEINVLQIPYTDYPVTPKINVMESNDQLKPYLFSNGKSHFSWPTFHVDKFYREFNVHDKEIDKKILQYMKDKKFNVLWINLKAFNKEEIKLIDKLKSLNESLSLKFSNDLFYVFTTN